MLFPLYHLCTHTHTVMSSTMQGLDVLGINHFVHLRKQKRERVPTRVVVKQAKGASKGLMEKRAHNVQWCSKKKKKERKKERKEKACAVTQQRAAVGSLQWLAIATHKHKFCFQNSLHCVVNVCRTERTRKRKAMQKCTVSENNCNVHNLLLPAPLSCFVFSLFPTHLPGCRGCAGT